MVKNLSLRAVSIYLRLLEVEHGLYYYFLCTCGQYPKKHPWGWVKELENSPIPPPSVHQTPSLL